MLEVKIVPIINIQKYNNYDGYILAITSQLQHLVVGVLTFTEVGFVTKDGKKVKFVANQQV